MSSTDQVNFALRQNKAIERQIAFEGLQSLTHAMAAEGPVYVGLGSVWFIDFQLAHRMLGSTKMVSVEHDDVVFKRAKFNRPWRTVDVRFGWSHQVIPSVLREQKYANKPWVVWLDIDGAVDEAFLQELRDLAVDLPENSTLLTTFKAVDSTYGRPADRNERLKTIFGDAIDDHPFGSSREAKDQQKMMTVLSQATLDTVESTVLKSGRLGGAVPSFRLMYKDAMPMVTVGWALPALDKLRAVQALVQDPSWAAIDSDPIMTPPLTHRELLALQSKMPSTQPLSEAAVTRLGFALDEDARSSYRKHYLRYPRYAQISG